MSQSTVSVPNTAGATFRANINLAFDTLLTNNSGANAPANTSAYMWWADTTTGLMKQRNSTNTGWISKGTIGNAFGLFDVNVAFTPDNNFDIGANGSSRPRDLFLGRDANIGANLSFSNWGATLPSGTVVQDRIVTNTTAVSVLPSNLAEVSSGFRHTWVPRNGSNRLLMRISGSLNPSAGASPSHELLGFAIYDVTNAQFVGVGVSAASRRALGAAIRPPGYDQNDAMEFIVEANVAAGNTASRTYTLYASGELNSNATTLNFNQSNLTGNTAGWNTPYNFRITEVTP